MSEEEIISRLYELADLKTKYLNVKRAALELKSWIDPVDSLQNEQTKKGKVLTLYKKIAPPNLKPKV